MIHTNQPQQSPFAPDNENHGNLPRRKFSANRQSGPSENYAGLNQNTSKDAILHSVNHA